MSLVPISRAMAIERLRDDGVVDGIERYRQPSCRHCGLRWCAPAWSAPLQNGVVVGIAPRRPAGRHVEGRRRVLDQRRARSSLAVEQVRLRCKRRASCQVLPSNMRIGRAGVSISFASAQQRQRFNRRHDAEPEGHELDRLGGFSAEEVDALVRLAEPLHARRCVESLELGFLRTSTGTSKAWPTKRISAVSDKTSRPFNAARRWPAERPAAHGTEDLAQHIGGALVGDGAVRHALEQHEIRGDQPIGRDDAGGRAAPRWSRCRAPRPLSRHAAARRRHRAPARSRADRGRARWR